MNAPAAAPHTAFYPIFLDLRGRACMVVGGGALATGKVRSLLDAGAAVTVVSPEVDEPLQASAAAGHILWHQRRFEEADVLGKFLVIAATDDRAVNAAVFLCADRAGVIGNAIDDLDHCSFIAPAVTRKGPVQVAVSTSGSSPALAKRIRDRIESHVLDDAEAALAVVMGAWRPRVKAALDGYLVRQRFWEGVLESCVPDLVASGDTARAEDTLGEALRRASGESSGRACAADASRAGTCAACAGGWR